VILLDTHIWLWWVQRDSRLTPRLEEVLRAHEADGLGVSVFSCWEVANLVRGGRLALPLPTREWLSTALAYPGVELLPLSLDVVVDANELPGDFHKDPADRLIVATARIHDCMLLTADAKILAYPHVKTF
jgi:PIN domain nuclease of toxin-antitoxin system